MVIKVLLCTTKCYNVLHRYYEVLLQQNSVLQRTTPALVCTTKYYNVLFQYYKVLLQYHAVLQSTTPVLQSTPTYYSTTTKYFSSITLYYKVLLQCYSVLQRTTPLLLCATKCYHVVLQYYKVLLQYYKVLLQYHKVIFQYYSVLPVLLCTAKYYSVLQNTSPVLMLHPWHMRRHLQCAEQQESSSNFTKYCACHAKWISWLTCVTYETSFTISGATRVSL